MEPEAFAELVEWIDVRWGRVEAWENATQLTTDFADVDKNAVWESLIQYTDNPEHKWPPRPRELRALALERMRHKPRPKLPETTERYGWEEFSKRNYGEVRTLGDVIREKAGVE